MPGVASIIVLDLFETEILDAFVEEEICYMSLCQIDRRFDVYGFLQRYLRRLGQYQPPARHGLHRHRRIEILHRLGDRHTGEPR